MISCRFFSVSVNCWTRSGAFQVASKSLENDSSSDEADDESKLVPTIDLPGVNVTADEFSVSSVFCSSVFDWTSSLQMNRKF